MVRTYKRRYTNARRGRQFNSYKSYTEDDLRNAVRAVKEQGLNYKEASERFEIPTSTIGRKVRGENSTQPSAGHPTLFSREEQNALIQHVLALSEWGFPCNLLDLRFLAKRYSDKCGRKVDMLKNSNNLPGKYWAQNFVKRHGNLISNKTCCSI